MENAINNFKNSVRKMNKPKNVSSTAWANAVNWSIEAWKCYVSGQKWVHNFEICCPEQYYLLLNKKGLFILESSENVDFVASQANMDWAVSLQTQIFEMQNRGEWVEALRWTKVLTKLHANDRPTPNEDAFVKSKKVIKGHKLIRINTAA